MGGAYAGVGTWLRLPVPTSPVDVFFGAAIFLLGYAVARHAALLEGRPMDRDFLYALLVAGSLTVFYVLVVSLLYATGHVSFLTVVLTIIGTIAANSLFDAVRTALDRVFYQSQFQRLRSNLRILAREAGTGGALLERLQAILTSLCRMFCIKRGFIALSEDDQWIVRATSEANPIGQAFALPLLAATETIGLLHTRRKGLPGMVLLVPLSAGDRQIGALVLGAKESRQPYSEADLELLEDVGDQMAALIHAIRLQEENAQTINAMVQDFREKERTLQLHTQALVAHQGAEVTQRVAQGAEDALLPQVEDALRHLHDFAYLGEQQLAKLHVVEQCWTARPQPVVTSVERGKALNAVLIRALGQLQPNGPLPGRDNTPPREWHQFIILNDSYVLNEPNRNIMSRLYIGEGTFNRTRRRALRNLAKSLAEMEQNLISP
jgi:GAF domain